MQLIPLPLQGPVDCGDTVKALAVTMDGRNLAAVVGERQLVSFGIRHQNVFRSDAEEFPHPIIGVKFDTTGKLYVVNQVMVDLREQIQPRKWGRDDISCPSIVCPNHTRETLVDVVVSPDGRTVTLCTQGKPNMVHHYSFDERKIIASAEADWCAYLPDGTMVLIQGRNMIEQGEGPSIASDLYDRPITKHWCRFSEPGAWDISSSGRTLIRSTDAGVDIWEARGRETNGLAEYLLERNLSKEVTPHHFAFTRGDSVAWIDPLTVDVHLCLQGRYVQCRLTYPGLEIEEAETKFSFPIAISHTGLVAVAYGTKIYFSQLTS